MNKALEINNKVNRSDMIADLDRTMRQLGIGYVFGLEDLDEASEISILVEEESNSSIDFAYSALSNRNYELFEQPFTAVCDEDRFLGNIEYDFVFGGIND